MAEYLPEHQKAPEENPEGDNYQPSEQEQKDIALVEKLFEQGKKNKSKYDDRWNDFYNMFRGKQWKEQRPSYRHSEVINLIFREIQSVVPIQMDTRPKFEFLPQDPSDIEFAKIMNQLSEADWSKYNWTEQITENIYDANILGTGIGGCCWDKDAENGIGAPSIDSEDPFYHFPDPDAIDFNKKMKWHIKAEPMPIETIKKKWPNGKYVKSDLINIKKLDLFDKDKARVRNPSESLVFADGNQSYDASEQANALVITCYLDGGFEISEDKVEEADESGELTVKFVQKKSHPLGRKIVVASKVLLESEDNPYEDGKIPFARVQNYVNQRQLWGISEIEQLESPQKVFNKLVSFSLDVLTLMGNPIWLIPSTAGIDTENIFNQPGLIMEYAGDKPPVRTEGVQLQPYVLQLIDRMKVWFDDIAGVQEVTRGAKPEGVTAASAIQSLQEAAQTRLRQKSRNLDSYLQNLGQMYFSRVMQYYTAPRVFRLTSDDNSLNFFKFHVEKTPDGKTLAQYRSFDQGEDGQLYESPQKTVEIKGALDVRVTTGSSLPFAKAEKEQRLLNFFDRGIIDEEEVLKGSDYPNWEAVLTRIMEKKAQMAMEAQAQKGAPPAA